MATAETEVKSMQEADSPQDVLAKLKAARDKATATLKAAEEAALQVEALTKQAPPAPQEAPPQAQKAAQEKFEQQATSDDDADEDEAQAAEATGGSETVVPEGRDPKAPYGYKNGTNIPRSKPGRKAKNGAQAKSASPKTKGKPGPKPKGAGEGSNKWSQSSGPVKLHPEQLNPNERIVLRAITGLNHVNAEIKTIKELADEAFPDSDPKKANDNTRNALRRLVPARFVDKVGRGQYRANKKGMESIIASIFKGPVGGKSQQMAH